MVSNSSQLPNFILVTAIVSSVCGLSSFLVQAEPKYPPCPSAAVEKYSLKKSFKMLMGNSQFCITWMLFSIYVGFFNSYSTFINQIMEPYGYNSTQAGIAGALLIFVGICCNHLAVG
jgi:Na+/melibiose symporter-like transporter